MGKRGRRHPERREPVDRGPVAEKLQDVIRLNLSPLEDSVELGASASFGEFGFFCQHLLTVSLPKPEYMLKSVYDAEAFIAKNPDPKVQLQAVFETCAYVHELRHFHDCFSTIAGLGLFGYHLKHIREFIAVCGQLAARDLHWELPAREWADDPSCPDEVQELVLRHRRESILLRLFMGSFLINVEEGRSAEPWRDGQFPQYGVNIPLYGLSSARGVRNGSSIERFEGTEQTTWYAVGFQTILEGNAQSMQRSLIEATWPDDVVARAWDALTSWTTDEKPAYDYNITDYLVTKLLATNDIERFPRRIVMQAGDAALMESAPVMDNGPRRYPGEAFAHVLSTTDWKKPLSECPRPHLADDAALQQMIHMLENTPKVEEVTEQMDKRGPLPIEAVEAWVHHEIAVPLLRTRLEQGHSVFFDMERYIKCAASLPAPPLLVTEGVRIQKLFSDEMLQLWAHYVVLQSLAQQVLSGARVIVCPRSNPAFAVLGCTNLSYAEGKSCDINLTWRRCGYWCKGMDTPTTRCVFTDWLRALRIAP